jgi:predicted phosphodiesterase
MEYRLIKLVSVICIIGLCSCKKVEIKGMFVSYETVNERFEQSMDWNETHPFREIIVPNDTYTIFVEGDSHVGETVNFIQFTQVAIESNACAMVMVGDLTTGNADDYTLFKSLLPHPDTLASFMMLGNHDLFFNGWESYRSLFGTSSYYFTVRTPQDVDLYICLDSGSSTLGSKQLDWLKTLLENERENYRRCVIFTHVNFFRDRHTSSTNPMIEELYVIMDLVLKHQVEMVVMGHDHKRSTDQTGNTTFITLDALVDGFEDAGYMKLNVDTGNMEYEFVNF